MSEMVWTDESRPYCPYGLSGNPPNVQWMAERLKGGLLVDVGANVGALAVATVLASPGSRCVAFEPQTRAADVLEGLTAANGLNGRVELHRLAVSSEPGEAVLKFPVEPSISGWGSIAEKPDFYEARNKKVPVESEPCKVTTLDTWWKEAGKPNVQVVKVDTQGTEVDVLLGGWELFQTVPFLFIEIHGPTLAEHGRTIEDLHRHLDRLEYNYAQFRVNLQCEKRAGWKRPS